jgi:GTPase SAR1 family protein
VGLIFAAAGREVCLWRAMEGSEESFDLHVKLLMLGDTGVGKTCLLLKYVQNSFSPTFITTIGIDFKIKIVSPSLSSETLFHPPPLSLSA